MAFNPGQMVVLKMALPSYGLDKGDGGVVVSIKNKDVEVEWVSEGRPPRRVTVQEGVLMPMARPKDAIGEGKEALGLRNLVVSLIGTYDTLEEVRERLGHVSAAADVTTKLAYKLGCEVAEIEPTVLGLSERVLSLKGEIATLTEAGKRHKLVIIGPSTLKRVYIDVGRDEAVKRYLVEHERAEIGDVPVSELDVGESFSATTVGPE